MAGLDSSLQYILYKDFQNNVSEARSFCFEWWTDRFAHHLIVGM